MMYSDHIHATIKPEQSGKTFYMIEKIKNTISLNKNNKQHYLLNIIINDLNISLVNQTTNRTEELKEHFEEVRIINFHSKSKDFTNKTTIEAQLILDLDKISDCDSDSDSDSDSDCDTNSDKNKYYNTSIINCCSHPQRFKDIFDKKDGLIIIIMKKCKKKNIDLNIKLYLDEFDKYYPTVKNNYTNLLQKIIKKKYNINNISAEGLTSTLDSIYKEEDKFKITPLKATYVEDLYTNLDEDFNFVNINNMSIENILDEYFKNAELGCKWYIPGKDNKKSHYNIKDICINKNMAVFIKNSDGLVLFTPYNRAGKTIKEKNNMCMNDIIVNAINENNLHKYQIVVTGYRCIGRGITFQNEDFMFDYGILINLNDRSSASQLFGRLRGNIKEYNNYEKPTVFIDKISYKKIKENNSISTQIGILAYYNDKNEASFIDKDTYNSLKKDNKDYYCQIFNSYE